jgi:hypothetical protein
MKKQLTIKLTRDQLQNIIDLIDNNNQFNAENPEIEQYWTTIIHILERQQ